MKNSYLNRVKNILKEMWEDFKTPSPYSPSTSGCCGFDPTFDLTNLQQKSILVNRTDNNLKNIKK